MSCISTSSRATQYKASFIVLLVCLCVAGLTVQAHADTPSTSAMDAMETSDPRARVVAVAVEAAHEAFKGNYLFAQSPIQVTTWLEASGLAQHTCLAVATSRHDLVAVTFRAYLACDEAEAKVLSVAIYNVQGEANYEEEAFKLLWTEGNAGAWRAPKDAADALKIWQEAVPSVVGLVDAVAGMPADVELEKALVWGFIKSGSLECEETVEEYGCSDSYERWRGFDGDEGVDDGCVRRPLLVSAIENGMLTEEDIGSFLHVLMPLVEVDAPKDDIARALLGRSHTWKNEGMRMALLGRVDASSVEEEALEGLSQGSLRHLYQQWGRGIVLKKLTATPDNLPIFNDAVRRRIDPVYAAERLGEIPGGDADSALIWLVERGDCWEASQAAEVLEGRGVKGFGVGEWPQAVGPEVLARLMCVASHRDVEVQRGVWARALPEGAFNVVEYGETVEGMGGEALQKLIEDHYQLRGVTSYSVVNKGDTFTISFGTAELTLRLQVDGRWVFESVDLYEEGCGC